MTSPEYAMSDLESLLPLWHQLREAGDEFVLVTVVDMEGSGYRKPGARMLIAADGRRAGTISGGCLEGEVGRKAFWHTRQGPVVRRISTKVEDGDVPFGMGCGGVLHLLMERRAMAEPLLMRLEAAFLERRPLAVVTKIEDGGFIRREYRSGMDENGPPLLNKQPELPRVGIPGKRTEWLGAQPDDDVKTSVFLEWIEPRQGLFVFGAGDDAIPLVKLARQLGWHVTVADGRSNLATSARFPEAQEVFSLSGGDFPKFELRSTDAAVLLTHSLQQDVRILGELLEHELAYIGVLGPRRRTFDLLGLIADDKDVPEAQRGEQIQAWMRRLHAPMGLDLGGDTPAEVALAAVAEIQKVRRKRTARPLRESLANAISER